MGMECRQDCACAHILCTLKISDPGTGCTARVTPSQQPSMEQYHILGRVGEGAHRVVLKAKHLKVRVQWPEL